MTDLVLSFSDRPGVSDTILQLRQLTQTDVQSGWRCCFDDLTLKQVTQLDWQNQAIGELNAKNHIAWSQGRKVVWLYQQWVLPKHLQAYPLQGLTLRMALTWWAEVAHVYVNGQLVQEGDLFDHSARVVLSAAATPGEVIWVAIRLVSPGHDDGALVRSRLIYESDYETIDPGFVADELSVLQSYLAALAPERLEELSAASKDLDWTGVSDAAQFNQSLQQLRDRLQPLSALLKQHTIFLVGHAHLDLAWLWDVSETWSAAERTFISALNLQQDFCDLTFCHSTPALYEWIEQNRPDLFAQIQQQVKAKRWEIVAGMWVEPELNLISGESIARQILYGQRYCQEKFGAISRVAWLPDSFGFCWQLPQLLRQGGIDYFVTQKLRWNDTTQFPHDVFKWRSPDGSEIFSLMSAPIGEGIDPTKMAAYTWDWTAKTGSFDALWLPGVGDHGGGPTRDMLEVAQRWQQSPFFPKLKFTRAEDYLDRLKLPEKLDHSTQAAPASEYQPASTWNSELYLEFHRGCYTTHADQKRFNRDCEALLYQAELWASLATIIAKAAYPKTQLESAWKKVLFNQFHDILPGSSIPQVFLDANQDWKAAYGIASDIESQALKTIAHQIALPTPPHPQAKAIVVFNSLNWQRSEVVDVEGWMTVYDDQGNSLQTHATINDGLSCTSFLATISSIGYRVFWLLPEAVAPAIEPLPMNYTLENEYLRVMVNSQTGDLDSIFDKINQREILAGAGNQLQAFQDSGQYWDAWNIDPNYAQHPLSSFTLEKIFWREKGLRSQIEVVRKLGQSQFHQVYSLSSNAAVVNIVTQVLWQERHVLVKAAFPLNLEADQATYEMPCGAIQRPTKPQTEREKAQWEVPALGWADLSDGNYGVSLLSDCKHGYDCQPNQIRLTLLRGSEFPDPEADLGTHTFTYAIYPHAGTWQVAQTVHKSYELSQPLQIVDLNNVSQQGTLPPAASLLSFSADNLILSAFKQSEDDAQYILRCYEGHGEPADLELTSDLVSIHQPVDLLERPLTEDHSPIQPWKIKSFSVLTHASLKP